MRPLKIDGTHSRLCLMHRINIQQQGIAKCIFSDKNCFILQINVWYTFKNTNFTVKVVRPGDCSHCQLKTLAVNSITCSSPRDFKCNKCKIYNILITKVWQIYLKVSEKKTLAQIHVLENRQDLRTKLSYSINTLRMFKNKICSPLLDVTNKAKVTKCHQNPITAKLFSILPSILLYCRQRDCLVERLIKSC